MNVSIISPVYRNATTLDELWQRIRSAIGDAPPIVFVNDASPDNAPAVLDRLQARDPNLRVVNHLSNKGQNYAVLAGFASTDTEWVVNLDADLQDPPEAIPSLLKAAEQVDADVVFGGRVGRYQSRRRMWTSTLYKRALAALTGVPSNAGIFAAVHRRVISRILDLGPPNPVVVPLLAHYATRPHSIPIERSFRPHGVSAYSTRQRIEVALRSTVMLLEARLHDSGVRVHSRHEYTPTVTTD